MRHAEAIQHGAGEMVAQMRIFPDGRVMTLSNGRELKEFKITPADIAELTRWLVEEQRVGEWKPEKVKIANTGQAIEMSPVKNTWDRQPDILIFTRNGKRHGIAVEHGGPGPVFDAIRERLWELAKQGAAAKAGASIHGKVLKPDGTPAAGVSVRVDDGIERWKFRGEGIPDLPKPVSTAADGTFSIEVPKGSAATNYEAFASSDEFAPLNAKVPAGGDVGVMQFAKG
ncbi:MAG: carboxypeptidase regulatory-like domain-containing protein, partial [Akkermansiaceae bacterium]|nr:carboxypeptidase regulatory-like domain-containing protein [Verrucomicrobiales bacterium]